MPSADAAPLAQGALLAHYAVGRRIGSGAMGTVYEAHDTALDRAVALKVVNPDLSGEPEIAERFAREARAAARANHPNLTHIYYVGSAGGQPFYAMEFVPGENLESRVSRAGPLSLAEAVDVLAQAARGLEAAHEAGVVHRDVKPSNLLLLPDGRVKVTDFGLAKSLAVDPSATVAGRLLGTPHYMSPEQCRGGDIDARTDVYALGLTAWYLLAGRPPFSGESLGSLINDQMNTPIPPLSSARPGVSHAADALVKRLCAKDPAARPQSMREVAGMLEAIRPRAVRPAPFAARAAALAADAILLSVVASALTYGAEQAAERVDALPAGAWGEGLRIAVAALAFLSQWGMEARFGGSLGKILLGVRVVAEDGSRASRARLLARYVLRFPSFFWIAVPHAATEPGRVDLSLGVAAVQLAAFALGAAWWPFAGRRTLSDALTRTRVVYSDAGGPKAASAP